VSLRGTLQALSLCVLASGACAAQPPFYLGVGSYELCREGQALQPYTPPCAVERVAAAEVVPEMLPGVNSLSMWITRHWQEDWYDAVEIGRASMESGLTPVFMFYWFADDISPAFVEANRAAYLSDLKRFTRFLSTIPGPKLVVLNPEFNENGIERYTPFNKLLLESMALVREAEGVQVGFCVGDFGDYDLTIDPVNWQAFHPSIREAAEAADFIAFQEMRALTRNTREQVENTAYRALAFSTYLHETYRKPVFWAYLALSSYGEDAEQLQAGVYRDVVSLLPQFRRQGGLIGFNSFHLIDIPDHVGYFNEGERHFGLLRRDGTPKDAFTAFRRLP
jgi:hypothetical protein